MHVCGPDEEIRYDRSKLSYHASARNGLVREMQGDWLFMLDTDHAFDPDILHRMLNTANRCCVDVLSGLYVAKSPPHSPLVFHWDEGAQLYAKIVKWETEERIFQADAVGAGTLLVRRSVFDTIQKELKEEPFSVIPPFSEDFSFCRRLQKLGIPLFCDPNIQSLHVATIGVHYGMTPVEELMHPTASFVVEAR